MPLVCDQAAVLDDVLREIPALIERCPDAGAGCPCTGAEVEDFGSVVQIKAWRLIVLEGDAGCKCVDAGRS